MVNPPPQGGKPTKKKPTKADWRTDGWGRWNGPIPGRFNQLLEPSMSSGFFLTSAGNTSG